MSVRVSEVLARSDFLDIRLLTADEVEATYPDFYAVQGDLHLVIMGNDVTVITGTRDELATIVTRMALMVGVPI